MRFSLASFGIGLLAVLAFWPHSATLASAPRPTPTKTPLYLQYDQIDRMPFGGGTPAPPGAFSQDYQAIMDAAKDQTEQPTPKPHRGFGGMLGGIMTGHMPGGMNPNGMLAMMKLGTLSRHTFYRNWVRTDDPVKETAIITKCDLHQYITLDLKAKTYTITDTTPCIDTTPGGGNPMVSSRMAQYNKPGTADMTMKSTATSLGPKTLEGYLTHGTSSVMEMATTNATGSCHNGDSKMSQVEYISGIAKPRAYCPLPKVSGRTPNFSGGSPSIGGCKPRMHMQGHPIMGNHTLLAFYRAMSFDASSMMGGRGGAAGAHPTMVMERGNIHWLTKEEVIPLFEIPEGFTKK
ncbi:MAG: hypothetical protein ACYDA1_05065 [Vulcanimicrobiaceae bacterium]